MIGTFKVKSVKEVTGIIFSGDKYPNRYGSPYTKNLTDPKSLLIRGELDGKDTSFFSPTVVVTITTGYLNYKSMDKNSWFNLIEEDQISAKGNPMFDGGTSPNVAISTPSTVIPKINVGDVIEISYKPKGEFNGIQTIKNVKIINK